MMPRYCDVTVCPWQWCSWAVLEGSLGTADALWFEVALYALASVSARALSWFSTGRSSKFVASS